VTTVLASVEKTQHLFTVEENPRLCGWGAEIVSIVAEEAIYALDGPIVRITTPHVPLAANPVLEDAQMPSAGSIAQAVHRSLEATA
jgi:pyruvate dehydrogenase E1 component beta subunit